MKLNQEQQQKVLTFVSKTKSSYKALNQKRKKELKQLYKEVMSYKGEKRADWASTIKVNFANQIESSVTARLTARNPRFIVSLRQSVDDIVSRYYPVKELEEDATPAEIRIYEQKKEEEKKFRKEVEEWATATQDYLNYAFDEYGFNERVRQGAKALIRYGNTYGTVSYKYETFRKKRNGKVEEVQADEYPVLDIISPFNIYIDPRYHQVNDSPAVILEFDKVRLSELYEDNDELMNLDKIKKVPNDSYNQNKQDIYQIMISNPSVGQDYKEVKHLKIDKFFGYYNFDPDDPTKEGFYEIWMANDALIVKAKEIPRNPVHSTGCFEDPEQHYSIGYVEPMLGLQREYNFKLNSAVEYINMGLNRSYFWDPNSGINPKALSSLGPGSVIPVTKGMEQAVTGLQEIPHREINGSYFANNNEVRRDMQSLSFTIDTTAPTSQQGFTNTATAVRARFFESNVMYADTLKHFEEFLTRIAYDMLDSIAENAKKDVVIAKLGEGKFKWAKPEMFEDAPLRYAIRVEVGSSSFDTVESRREEALAFWTIMKEAKAAGVDVDLEKGIHDIIRSFEKKSPEEYMKRDLTGILGLFGGGEVPKAPSQAAVEATAEAEPSLDNPAELTEAVVQGSLTA